MRLISLFLGVIIICVGASYAVADGLIDKIARGTYAYPGTLRPISEPLIIVPLQHLPFRTYTELKIEGPDGSLEFESYGFVSREYDSETDGLRLRSEVDSAVRGQEVLVARIERVTETTVGEREVSARAEGYAVFDLGSGMILDSFIHVFAQGQIGNVRTDGVNLYAATTTEGVDRRRQPHRRGEPFQGLKQEGRQ